MRLAALQRSRPLLGTELMASWRARAGTFPRKLVSALTAAAMPWRSRDLLTRTGHAAIRAILALNRVYLPHRQPKWQRHLTTGLSLVPERLAERLESLSNGRPEEALQAAEALLQRS